MSVTWQYEFPRNGNAWDIIGRVFIYFGSELQLVNKGVVLKGAMALEFSIQSLPRKGPNPASQMLRISNGW
jgi:hypothetical protein